MSHEGRCEISQALLTGGGGTRAQAGRRFRSYSLQSGIADRFRDPRSRLVRGGALSQLTST